MPYVGNIPAEKYASFAVQHFTTSATTSYTLDHSVANENDIRLVINNVIQQPGGSYAYTAANTTLTLSSATSGTDTMYCVFLGKAVQTVNPGSGSVGTSQLADESVNEAKLKVSNSPTNGYVLSAQSGAAGGLTWAADAGGAALTGSTDNTVTTVTGANAIQGETNFIYNGTIVGCGADGANADLGVGLHIKLGDSSASAQDDADALVIEDTHGSGMSILSGNDDEGKINFGDDGDNDIGGIIYAHANNDMTLRCNAGTAFKLTDGTAKFFTTTDFGGTRCHIKGNFYAQRGLGLNSSDGASSGNQVNMVYFGVENSAQGSITAGAGSVVYNTSSDYRRKENVSNLTGSIDRVKQFKPYRFNFTDDPSKKVRDGFFAHEVTSIVPESVTGEKDAVEKYRDGQDIPEGKSVGDNILDEEGNTIPDYQGIDHSKLVPLLTSALQEAITKIETLETKVTALENA